MKLLDNKEGKHIVSVRQCCFYVGDKEPEINYWWPSYSYDKGFNSGLLKQKTKEYWIEASIVSVWRVMMWGAFNQEQEWGHISKSITDNLIE